MKAVSPTRSTTEFDSFTELAGWQAAATAMHIQKIRTVLNQTAL
jgi:hypothetical protein